LSADEPSAWLIANLDLLPFRGDALDVACGRGRHAIALARAGLAVHAVDRDAEALAALRSAAERQRLRIAIQRLDLESGTADLGHETYDVITVFNYLHRPLFPALLAALRPAGLLLYETFTVEQAARGRPTDPRFLLEQGELKRLVAPLEIVREREGEVDGRMVAAAAARKSG
jgi:tellurite methyltransferase